MRSVPLRSLLLHAVLRLSREAPVDTAEIFRSMARGEMREHSFGFEKRATLVPSANTVPVAFLDRIFALARFVGPYLETSELIQRDFW
jgi:hypothetical protein